MSEVKVTRSESLDLNSLYARYRAGTGSPDGQPRMGVEIERWFLNPETLAMMTPAQSQKMLEGLAQKDRSAERWYEQSGQRTAQPAPGRPLVCVNSNGLSYQLELCGVLEAATAPVLARQPEKLFAQISTASADMREIATQLGMTDYCAALPGSIRIEDCAQNMVARERLQSEWAKFNASGPNNPGLRTMGLATSAQLSVSYNGPQEAGEIMTLGTLLSPILYAAFANTTGFLEGRATKQMVPRANWWLAHNKTAPRGGFPSAVFAGIVANDLTGLTDRWIDYVRTVPMVYYYDTAQKPQFGASPSFNQLTAEGNGTAANYALAESLVWPDVKLIGGQRIELRMPDSGWWQPAALGMLGAAVMTNPEARRALMGELVTNSKLSPDGLLVSRLLVGNLGKAAPYGQRKINEMFALVADYLPKDMVTMAGKAGQRFTEVLRTGQTDADDWRQRLRGITDAKVADRMVLGS